MQKRIKKELKQWKCWIKSPPGENLASPGHLLQISCDEPDAVICEMLLSMTPPISIHNRDAVQHIEQCITRERPERLQKEHVQNGELVQLYCLSYRHEAGERNARISNARLQKAVDVVRSHCTVLGYPFYSLWIDSLYDKGSQDPLGDWSDRGLPPYSFCYVVGIPSTGGFEEDLKRAWIRCEHQLAACSRGMLFHVNDVRPKWTDEYNIHSRGPRHIKIAGGFRDAAWALGGLSIAVCFGLLEKAEASFPQDLIMLKTWARKTLCSKWKMVCMERLSLSLPVSSKTPKRLGRVKHVLENLTRIHMGICHLNRQHWGVIAVGELFQPLGSRRPWNTGFEVTNAICAPMDLGAEDGKTEEIFTEINEKSVAFLVKCKSREGQRTRGLILTYWRKNEFEAFIMPSTPIALDVELESDGSSNFIATGYGFVHSSAVCRAFQTRGDIFDMNELVSPEMLGKAMTNLTGWYYGSMERIGLSVETMIRTDPSQWEVWGRDNYLRNKLSSVT